MVTSDTERVPDGAAVTPTAKTAGSGPVTRTTGASVEAFVDGVPDARRRADAEVLLELFGRATGQPAEMWGPSIVGFGRAVLRPGEQEWLATGFSPRARQHSIYLMDGTEAHPELLARLGRHRTGRGCPT